MPSDTAPTDRAVDVSVVIPTRGRSDLLAQALASVQEQDVDGVVECLVVFDQVEPAAEIERDGDRPVRVLPNTRTPGPAGGRNTGILAARGRVVAFLDDDDLWRRDKLRLQLETMRTSGRRAVVSTIALLNGGTRTVRTVEATSLDYRDLLRSRTQSAHQSTLVVDASHLRDVVGLFDEEVPASYGEDYDWLLRAAAVEPLAVVPEALVDVRWHAGSYFFDRWQVIVDALGYLTAKHPDLLADRQGAAVLCGRLAYSHAALGRRREAVRWLRETLRRNPGELRWVITLPVLVDPRLGLPVLRLLRRLTGRSI